MAWPAAALAALVLTAPAADTLPLHGGARGPAVSPQGRVVVEMRGDLWLLSNVDAPEAIRLTSTWLWERDAAWTPDGSAVVYTVGDEPSRDLWRLEVGPAGPVGDPIPLTRSDEADSEPSPLPDGSVVFVRGIGRWARLQLLLPDGRERPLGDGDAPVSSPAASPDGRRVAYVAGTGRDTMLRLLDLETGEDRSVGSLRDVAHPSWSPDGERIAVATRDGDGGVRITNPAGSYANLASAGAAESAWTPDGGLLLADLPPRGPTYNGDPNRLGEREPQRLFPRTGALRLVRDVGTPDPGERLAARFRVDGTSHADFVLDRMALRTARLYYSGVGRDDARRVWERAVDEARPRARRATSESELEAVIHDLLEGRPPLRVSVGGRAAVSSAHPLATQAGLEALRRGGNVVDAAVAVSFALGVVEPDASGVGGYGQMVIHLVGMSEPVVIDFLTRVPEAATLSNGSLLDADGELPDHGPVLANVPGTVDGMGLAYQRYGSGAVAWSELIEPAIRLAENGFVLDDAFTTTLDREWAAYRDSPAASELFYREGVPLQAGDTLRNPDLAWTLRQISEGGARAFYEGEIAHRMVDDLRREGNAMTLLDLRRYYAVEREPVAGSYRGHAVYGSAPPTSGGASLVSKLHMLELEEAGGAYADDPAKLHAMIEAWKLATPTRGRIADPGLWPVDVAPFESKDTARVRWRCFDEGRALVGSVPARVADCPARSSATGGGEALLGALGAESGELCHSSPALVEGSCRAAGTTAFAVADGEGNMVAVTQTLGTWGGNFYVTPGLGFLYNDKLSSYASDPDRYNARIPFARNVTSISPALVFEGTGPDKRPLLAVGAAGNAWITSAVYQVIVGVVDGRLDPQRALEQPRFLVGGRGPDRVVQYEDAFAPEVLERLRAMGHELRPISLRGELRMGYGAAVLVQDGMAIAGADPRRSGAAGAVRER